MKKLQPLRKALFVISCGVLASCSQPAWSASLQTSQTATQESAPQIPVLNWEPRSDWMNVKTAGAMGDGKADDTAAIQNVFDSFKEGGTVYFPTGTYRITRTIVFKGPFTGASVIGHGRDTRLVWDGEAGGRLYSDDGIAHSRYVGLTFDGANKAAIGFWHHSDMRFETEVRHQHLAFYNFTEAGVATSNEDKFALAETLFENCIFDNCKVGVRFRSFNDYNLTFTGCEFRNNSIGIEAVRGNFYARNCHFQKNGLIDMIIAGEHNSSVRRCTSVGSGAFLAHRSAVAALTVQDCHVDRWGAPSGALELGGAPVIMFDNVFTNPPQGNAPVQLLGKQQLIASENRFEGSARLTSVNPNAHVFNVPAGKRSGSIRAANQSFLQDTAQIATKVFDVKRDFGAKGDGSDDTKAIQAAIDAAREHGKGAIAYLPTGTYGIKSTLRITGRDYYFGGSGFRTALVWRGEDGGTMISVHDPQNIHLEHINVGSHDAGIIENGIDILHTSSGGNSHMTYDGVFIFGMYQKQPFRKGLHFRGLGKSDTVVMPHVQGNMQFTDSAQATILGNATYEGSITVQGKDKRRDGFLGFQTRLATIVTHGLYIRDNHSFVASDFYIEESDDGIVLEGMPGDPAGRVTIAGAKIHIKEKPAGADRASALDIRNYEGQIFFGPYQFYPGSQAVRFRQQGERPAELFLQGVSFYGVMPTLEKQDAAKVFAVGNNAVDTRPLEYLDSSNLPESALKNLSNGMDDLRRLGELDLRLNFPRAN